MAPQVITLPRVTLFKRVEVRDTIERRPGELLDLRQARRWGFEVENFHNQSVTITLIGGTEPSPGGAGSTGVSATIAANTREPIVTDIWLPFLGVTAQYAVAPTSGYLNVYGEVQEFAEEGEE